MFRTLVLWNAGRVTLLCVHYRRGMAIIHQATLSPSKLELLTEHVQTIPEIAAHVGADLRQVGAFRFDDPAGQVGIEGHILTSDSGSYLHIPVTYRNEEWPEAKDSLIGTMQHSVLGERWVYDACVDPVYVGELVRVIVTGGSEVAEIVETPDGQVPRDPSVNVRGSGATGAKLPELTEPSVARVGTETHINAGSVSVVVRHVLSPELDQVAPALTGTWKLAADPMTLAVLA